MSYAYVVMPGAPRFSGSHLRSTCSPRPRRSVAPSTDIRVLLRLAREQGGRHRRAPAKVPVPGQQRVDVHGGREPRLPPRPPRRQRCVLCFVFCVLCCSCFPLCCHVRAYLGWERRLRDLDAEHVRAGDPVGQDVPRARRLVHGEERGDGPLRRDPVQDEGKPSSTFYLSFSTVLSTHPNRSYGEQGYFSGTYNAIQGRIRRGNSDIGEVTGKWSATMEFKSPKVRA